MRSQRNILRRISSFGTSKAPPTTPVPGKLKVNSVESGRSWLESRRSSAYLWFSLRSTLPSSFIQRMKISAWILTLISPEHNLTISEFPEFQSFHDLHRYSIDHHEEFWARISRSMISWEKDFTITARDPRLHPPIWPVQDVSCETGRTYWDFDRAVSVCESPITANNDFSKGRIEWFTDGELNASGTFSFFAAFWLV